MQAETNLKTSIAVLRESALGIKPLQEYYKSLPYLETLSK